MTEEQVQEVMVLVQDLFRFAYAQDWDGAVNVRDDIDLKLSEQVQEMPDYTVTDSGFRWDAERQQHIPQLTIEFDPVPVNGGSMSKGWKDRDATATMLSAAPTQAEQHEPWVCGIMPLVDGYAKAVHDGDDAACVVLRKVIDASIDALEAASQREQWLPIETAPKDGTTILLAHKNMFTEGPAMYVTAGKWVQEYPINGLYVDVWVCPLGVLPSYTPTHWKPLPPPPNTTNSDVDGF